VAQGASILPHLEREFYQAADCLRSIARLMLLRPGVYLSTEFSGSRTAETGSRPVAGVAVATTPMNWLASIDRAVAAPSHVSSDGGTCGLWIAIDQAPGGVDDWREEYSRCAFVERGRGRALVMEAEGDTQVSVSYRQRNAQEDLEDVAVWFFTLDDDGIRDVSMGEAPAHSGSVQSLLVGKIP
jgi:hypothetical protein